MRGDDKNTAIFTAYEDEEPFDAAGGEKNLLAAVLLNAMADLKKSGDVSRKATEFFLSKDENYIFSFRTICNFLSIDPERILIVTGLKKPR